MTSITAKQYLEPFDQIADLSEIEKIDYFLAFPRCIFLTPAEINNLDNLKSCYIEKLAEWEKTPDDEFFKDYSKPVIDVYELKFIHLKLQKIPLWKWIIYENKTLKILQAYNP